MRRIITSFSLVALLLVLAEAGWVQPQTTPPSVPQKIGLPDELQMPGRLEGTGTHFELTDSEYLNVTVDSSEPIKLVLESVPQMVTMHIESASGAASTQITLGGFLPWTTYYKYEDDYHNLESFTTDGDGSYTYTHDLSKPHLVFIQSMLSSTKFIRDDATGGDCTSIGTWNSGTKTCTLTMDLTEPIQIDSDRITLDGNGHTITGSNTGYGVYLSGRTGVTIKNLNITTFYQGVSLISSSDNTLTSNSAISNTYSGINLDFSSNNNTLAINIVTSTKGTGISLSRSSSNTVTGNTVSNTDMGIRLNASSNNNILRGNNCSFHSGTGIYVYESNDNTIVDNEAWRIYNRVIHISYSSNNKVYNNDFINDRWKQAAVHGGSGNLFNLSAPTGGNYWSDYDTPAEGCNDANGDGFCDLPYVFFGGQDNLPWTRQDGWLDSTPPTTTDNSPVAWQKANFTVTLVCTDNPGGSGCKETKYRVDGGAWQTGNSITISTEGDHLIEYYSLDNVGNQESVKSTHAKLDKTPPSVSITSPQAQDYVHTATLNVTWSASDGLSGLASSSGTLDGSAVTNGQLIDLFLLSLGSHLVVVSASDKAGNTASASVTFKVVADINSLIAATERAYALGWINKQDVYNGLMDKLNAAKAAIERGQFNAAKNQLNAFISLLDAQRGKAVNQRAYDLLKADALYVMNKLP